MRDLAETAGKDLIYSLAYENDNLFLCVTAYPSMTKKRFVNHDNTADGDLRAVFLVDENDFDTTQDELVSIFDAMIRLEQIEVPDDFEVRIPDEVE